MSREQKRRVAASHEVRAKKTKTDRGLGQDAPDRP